jgi:hypothetical protein
MLHIFAKANQFALNHKMGLGPFQKAATRKGGSLNALA